MNNSNDDSSDAILFGMVNDALFRLAVPAHMNGYGYLATAISLVVRDPSYIRGVTNRLYLDVACINGSTPQRVERSMRTAIETACIRCREDLFDEYFGGAVNPRTGKPTNAMFIATLAHRIRAEMLRMGK